MTDTDWKPKNPCIECGIETKPCPLLPAGCFLVDGYEGEIEGQKRLLRYQKTHKPDLYYFIDDEQYAKYIASLLKQLEGLK